MTNEITTAQFIKNAFYKTCFCIGLGTASYYAYAQVVQWVGSPMTRASSQMGISGLQEKVNALSASEAAALANGPSDTNADSGTAGYRPNKKLYLITENKTAGVAAPAASPAAPTETAAADKKEGDAKDGEKKDADKKDGDAVAKTEEGGIPPEGGGPVNAIGLPMYPAPGGTDPQVAATPTNPNAAALAAANLASGGIPNNPNAASDSNASNPTAVSSSSTNIFSAPAVNLAASDITQLTGTSMKGVISESTENVSGQVCTLGADGSSLTGCVANNSYSINTDRWNETFGLSSAATFSISALSGTSNVTVNVALSVQNLSQTYQSLSSTVSPTSVTITSEVKNGVTYKVYELKLPDLNGLNSEKLTGVTATLVYAESTNGTGAMSTDSTLTFTRSNVQTTGTNWDVTTVNRAPAANAQVIVASSIGYTMSLEKSP
jgi:hypothetical protein